MKAGVKTGWWGIFARLAVTVACCVALFAWIEGRALWANLSRLSPLALVAALSLHLLIILLLGWRWQGIVRAVGRMAGFGWAARLTFVTTFLNMILPLSVSGDIGRVWLGRMGGVDLRAGITSAILDRMTGLIGLGLLLFVSAALLPAPWLPHEARLCMILLLPVMLAGLWFIAAFADSGVSRRPALQWLGEVAATAKRFLRPWPLARAVAQSLAAHVLAVAVVFVSALGTDVALTLGQAFLLVPVVLLATMLPFSIGGWGVREAAAVAVLSLAGISAEGALSLSLIFGLTQVAVSGVGTLLCLAWSGGRLSRARS